MGEQYGVRSAVEAAGAVGESSRGAAAISESLVAAMLL
jgi:hypothetical protein